MISDPAKSKKILERLMSAAQAHGTSNLAAMLGVSVQAVYDAKRRDKVPDAWVRTIAEAHNVSADWLFFGRGDMRPPSAPAKSGAPAHVVFTVVEALEEYLQGTGANLPPTRKASLASRLCREVADIEAQGEKIRLGQMLRLIQQAVTEEAPSPLETAGETERPESM